jgi:hypothetical protein
MARRPAPFLGLAAALILAACGDTPASPTTGGGATSGSPRDAATGQRTVTHILLGYRGAMRARPTTTRSKEQARAVANSLLQDVTGGRSFEELVEKFTDDRDPKTGKPNTNNGKPGSYTWPTQDIPQMAPTFEKASKELPVGKVTPEPVETPFGYHIIRRDK